MVFFLHFHGSNPQLLALPAQVLRHVFVHIVEHGRGAGHAAIEQGAVALGLFLRGGYLGLQLQSSAGRYLDGSSDVECGPAR